MKIADSTVVVTGGGNGIGQQLVLELLRRNARVAAVDLREEALAETTRLAAAGERLSIHPVDVTDRAAVEALPELVKMAHGHVDALVNVAGVIQHFVPFADLDYPEMERVFAVNLWGVIHTCHAFLPLLLERPSAALVNVSSMGGLAPVPGQTIYGASKAAVTLLTEGLYAELRNTSVAVTTVLPGGVATDIVDNSGATVPGSEHPDSGRPGSEQPDGERQSDTKVAANLTSAPDAARRIADGIEKGAFRVLIGNDAKMVDRISRLSPQRATEMIAKRMASLLN